MYLDTCPYRFKYELVAWATEYFKESKNNFNKMSKSQLFGKYKAHNKKER